MAKKPKLHVGDWVRCVNNSMSPLVPKGSRPVDPDLKKGQVYRVYAVTVDLLDKEAEQYVSVAHLMPLDSESLYAQRFRKLTPAQLKKFLKSPRRKA